MSSNIESNGTVALGSRVNIYDSQGEEFDLDRDPGDPTEPSHDTATDDSPDRDFPSVDELLDRDRGSHTYVEGVNRESFVAGTILRSYDNPPLFCPECWHQFEAEVELSDPEHHLPLVEVNHDFDNDDATATSVEIQKHDHRRHRHCPDCGTVSFGGKLGDRDIPTFVDIVKWALDEFDVQRSSRRDEIIGAARERKSQLGQSDQANMERIVREVRYSLDPEHPQ